VNSESPDKTRGRVLFETVALLAVFLVLAFCPAKVKPLAYVVGVVYALVDRRRRHRSWNDIGVKTKNYAGDFWSTWYFFLVVEIGTVATFFITRQYWPVFLDHVLGRAPALDAAYLAKAVLNVIIVTLMEELIYRGLFQERLGWYIGKVPALIVASLVFGLMHYAPGQAPVVATDIALVVFDGIFYGLIYAKTRSIFISWTAHLVADLISIALVCTLYIH
jgi:membrane protease YdiL (CAAX protease family)